MRNSVVSILAAASIAAAQSSTISAPKVTNSAVATYIATIPAKEGSPSGSIAAMTAEDGVGVKFMVSFSGLPDYGAPFSYHLHDKPVAANGSCASAGAHIDPYKRGEDPPCDASKPETCQTGDLAGKYGKFSSSSYSTEYLDPYSSTDPSNPAYFGNLSFVLHLSNKTRIACANFMMVGSGYPTGNITHPSSTGGMPVPMPTPMPTTASPSAPAEFTGAAAKVVGGTGAMLAAAAAFIL